jgi:hypothetical protein
MKRSARVAAVAAILGAVVVPMQPADAWWGWGDGYGGFGFNVSAHGGGWGDYWAPYYGGYPYYGYGQPYGWHGYPGNAAYYPYRGVPLPTARDTGATGSDGTD